MNAYKKFGYYYDEIMAEMNYHEWVDFLEPYLTKKSEILDLACGSGSLAILLSLLGFQVEGLDLSSTILEIAYEKSKINRQRITYYHQNMTDIQIDKKYDVITCFFDSVNFLASKKELNMLFQTVYDHLKPNGYFIFDLFSKSMYEEYKDSIFEKDYTNFKIKWTTNGDDKNMELTHKITITEDGEDICEEYKEYFYDYKKIETPLFKIVRISGDFNDDIEDEDERVLIVMQRQ